MSLKKIKKLAIANRGEVALRIIHACKELGIKSLLLHSEPDENTLAYRMADETKCIGGAMSAQSYLDIDKNISACISAKADAIHPGFGFLSENAFFAKKVVESGLIFVGPDYRSIELLGDKIESKKLAIKLGIPIVPDYRGEDQSADILVQEAKKIGFPVIVKAAFGGGGRGMKIINSLSEALEQIESAKREAKAAFGNDKVFLEKYLNSAKHIEIQIFSDNNSETVFLYERECTIQRKHQKIIEEALSVSLDEKLRSTLSEAAVNLAKAAKYIGAGTVEFLLQDGKFYFLEMNTRLQVEHPVTEMVLGIDLVKAQILTADGSFKLWDQKTLIPRGHAIECRIYAENPYLGGIPSTGELGHMFWPQAPGRRFEVAYEPGDSVTSFYDSMMAKIIVHDENRIRAIQKMISTLEQTIVFGVHQNIPFLKEILQHKNYLDNTHTTNFIEQFFPDGLEPKELNEQQIAFAEAAYKSLGSYNSNSTADAQNLNASQSNKSVWSEGWSNL